MTSDDAVRVRLNAARACVACLGALPEALSGVAVGGSVARGVADAWSDIELILYWSDMPDDALRRALVARMGAHHAFPFKATDALADSPEQVEDCVVMRDGLRVDVVHLQASLLEVWLRRMVERPDPHLGIQKIAASLCDEAIVHGAAFFEPVRALIAPYPEPLARATVELCLGALGGAPWEMALARGDVHLFYSAVSWKVRRLLPVVFALNRRYFPGEKHAQATVSALPHLPPGFWPELMRVFDVDRAEAGPMLRAIIERTVAMAEAELGPLDDAMYRALNANPRRRWG